MRNWNHALEIASLSCQEVIKIWKQTRWSNDKTIIELGYRKIYCDLSVSRRSIICWSRRLRQIIDLLASDNSRHFAQPRPTVVNYFSSKCKIRLPVTRTWRKSAGSENTGNGKFNELNFFTTNYRLNIASPVWGWAACAISPRVTTRHFYFKMLRHVS